MGKVLGNLLHLPLAPAFGGDDLLLIYDAETRSARQITVAQLMADLQGGGSGAGWTPTLSVVADGERRVLSVAAWLGGSGDPPTAGVFLGPGGFVQEASQAIDVRGPSGVGGTLDPSFTLNGGYF